jgi:hypothetical protein
VQNEENETATSLNSTATFRQNHQFIDGMVSNTDKAFNKAELQEINRYA